MHNKLRIFWSFVIWGPSWPFWFCSAGRHRTARWEWGSEAPKQLHAMARWGATFRQVQAMAGLWDVDIRRWAAWLDNTSIDTCSSLSIPSHSLFFGSVQTDCRGERERENGRDGEMGKRGATKQRHRGRRERQEIDGRKRRLDSLKTDRMKDRDLRLSQFIYRAHCKKSLQRYQAQLNNHKVNYRNRQQQI